MQPVTLNTADSINIKFYGAAWEAAKLHHTFAGSGKDVNNFYRTRAVELRVHAGPFLKN